MEHVRMRPFHTIGDVGVPVIKLVYEVVDNSIDEA
jgi:DNA gyrase/topoisomerase IV subunit B